MVNIYFVLSQASCQGGCGLPGLGREGVWVPGEGGGLMFTGAVGWVMYTAGCLTSAD